MPGRLALSLGTLAAAAVLAGGAHAATFRYSLDTDIDYVDPALAYYVPTWEILYATCSMLVSYPDAPAPRGARLVPDGAAAMPTVSRDGKTYTFRIRPGRRFSNGVTITARHYAWGLKRSLHWRMRGPARDLFRDVRGMTDEYASATGIRVLPRKRLQIQLMRRAPDLLARLAMPFGCAVPLAMPLDSEVGTPVAGSGPYYIADWSPRRSILLRRNRFYRGPRPHRVDEVVYDIGLPPATIKLKIDQGTTDHGPIQPAAHAQLGVQHGVRRRSPGRYFVNSIGTLRYLAMNHERELFGKPGGGRRAGLGNVPLKKAVNYAIDRTALVDQRGAYGSSFADQALPGAMPGARNEAIYPVRPDLARARALAAGNTRSGRGVMYPICMSALCFNWALVVQRNLRDIGVDMDIRQFPRCLGCGDKSHIRGEPFDMSVESWVAPYFDPSHFMLMFDGRTLRPLRNTNRSYFDSTRYNRKIARAATMSGQARYRAFGALDVDLLRNAAPIAAFMHDNSRRYFSARVRNFFEHPVYGIDLPAIAVE
jgi:oligopeptide transport system substrate-binding protein